MDSQELTKEQEIVLKYLIDSGCSVRRKLSREGNVVFKAIGSASFSGYVFQSGTVFIFSEHTEPFDQPCTPFIETARKVLGDVGAKGFFRSKGISEKKKKINKSEIKVELDSDLQSIPLCLYQCPNALTRNDTTMVQTNSVFHWIRKPPASWMNSASKFDYKDLKIKHTPCLLQGGEYKTIGWLDLDGKSNPNRTFTDHMIDKMWDDDRVCAQFRSLSGNGWAIGVCIEATTPDEYEAAMKRALDDFTQDYGGLQFDTTCIRYKQLRALSHDPKLRTKSHCRYYKGVTMLPESLEKELKKGSEHVKKIGSGANKQTYVCEPTMLEELDYVCKMLEVEITEDAWTGKRCFKLKGQSQKDLNSIYLAIMNAELERNGNVYKLKKTEICDYVITRTVVKDAVIDTVFNEDWDGVDRWGELRVALNLDDYSLNAFQLWFRQGAALLFNKGDQSDIQRNFMLILYSKQQHIGKTELARKLACNTGSFTQKRLVAENKDSMMDIYSHWIYEYGELGSQFRKTDINILKSFVTDVAISYRRPYDREATVYPVRTSVIGTTNEQDLFMDPSGNRRYLVVDCAWNRDNWPLINELDIKQLWRQARVEYLKGLPHTLSLDQQIENERRCRSKHASSKELYIIADVLSKPKPGQMPVTRIDTQRNVVTVDMATMIERIRDDWKDIKLPAIIRELEFLGFKRYSGRLGDVFIIPREEYEDLIWKAKQADIDESEIKRWKEGPTPEIIITDRPMKPVKKVEEKVEKKVEEPKPEPRPEPRPEPKPKPKPRLEETMPEVRHDSDITQQLKPPKSLFSLIRR